MKHGIRILLLFVSVLIAGLKVSAQPYQSMFGKNSTTWTIAEEWFDVTHSNWYTSDSDSVLNGKVYHNVKVAYSGPHVALIREDTLPGKGWIITQKNQTEHLLYDLNLHEGDSFFMHKYLGPMFDSWVTVDSVYLAGNKKHVRMNWLLTQGGKSEKLTFIEGLGPNAGLLYLTTEFPNYLLCSDKDSVSYFTNTLYNGECFLEYGGIDELNTKPALTIQPNPFNQSAVIKIDEQLKGKSTLIIVNQLGQTIRKIENVHSGEMELTRDGMREGLYFLMLESDGIISTGTKFLIE